MTEDPLRESQALHLRGTTSREDLLDAGVQELRERTCRSCAEVLDSCGRVMWAFGLAPGPARRALALVVQMGGSLAKGTVVLLDSGNAYAAAALLRQFVEVEYLLCLFSSDLEECKKWLESSPADLRKEFAPARMRKRSNKRFQDDQYWAHCEIGGHPHPAGALLLPEHGFRNPLIPPIASTNLLWLDLAQHMDRAIGFLEAATHVVADIPAVVHHLTDARASIAMWRATERTAGHL